MVPSCPPWGSLHPTARGLRRSFASCPSMSSLGPTLSHRGRRRTGCTTPTSPTPVALRPARQFCSYETTSLSSCPPSRDTQNSLTKGELSQRQLREARKRPGAPGGAPLVLRTVGRDSVLEGEGQGDAVLRGLSSSHPTGGGRLSGCSSCFGEVCLFFLSADGHFPAISALAAWQKLGWG